MATTNTTPGELSLSTLLASMEPTLHPETFVFVTLTHDFSLPPGIYIQMLFQESEGPTIITTMESARKHGLTFTFPSRMITLSVHSSLEAVGFMAAITARLAKENIGVNPVSGYHHDHLFVPLQTGENCLRMLKTMSEEARMDQENARMRDFIDGLIAGQQGDWSRKDRT